MNSRIRTAIGDAMALLRVSDVGAATAAIQRALGGMEPRGEQPVSRNAEPADTVVPPARRLGEVLRGLRAGRASEADAMERRLPAADDERDDGFTSRRHRTAAGPLNYKLYRPSGRGRELALVLMLHGCKQDPDDFARGTRMNRLADEFDVLVAYPHQPRTANAQGCWNWFDTRHQQRGSGEPAMLAQLALDLAQEFKVGPGRVFAAGLSAGAAMADVLAETYPDVFAAVGVHSGLPYRAANDVISAFAAMKAGAKAAPRDGAFNGCRKIIFHGRADTTVNSSNGDATFERMRVRHPGSVVLIEPVPQESGVTRQVLTSQSGATLAEYWLMQDAAHAWSGGSRNGSFAEPNGPDASREMIRFFLG